MRDGGDAYRRAMNEECAACGADRFGWTFVAVVLSGLLAYKTAWQEGLPGLALVCSSHAAIAQGMAMLVKHRPALYTRHRELLVTAALFNLTWVVLLLAWYGGTVIISFHGGSTLRLLALMTLATSAIWICQYTLYSRMVLSRAAVALPLLAVVRLASGRSVCQCQFSVLSAAGIADPPLAALHEALSLVHPATAAAVALLPLPVTALEQCVAVYGWLELLLGVLLPLTVLAALEQRARRLFAAWQARQAAQREAQASTSQQQPPQQPPQQQQGQQQQQQGQQQPLQPWPGWQLAAMLTGSSDVVGAYGPWGAEGRAAVLAEEQQAETMKRPLAWAIHFHLLSSLAWLAANALALMV
ncbi:hypothetical protein ABPG75_002555 [Micractinium tetrahymenae]